MESDETNEVVIGQQIADALAREESHRGAWSGPSSPLEGVRYDSAEGDLLRFRDSPADAQVENFLEGAAELTSEHLASVRGALTTDDFYTLITFARRSVVRALRGAPVGVLGRALAGIALIDAARVDPRDVSWVTAIAVWGVQHLDASRDDVLRDAERMGSTSAIEAVNRFLQGRIELADWGLTEVVTASGIGLVQSDFTAYDPTSNLLDAALELADALESDLYEPPSLTIASDIPRVWFRNADEALLARSLGDVRATVSMRSRPQAGATPDAERQHLLAFVSECTDQQAATWLTNAARAAAGGSHHTAASSRGRCFTVLIARSIYEGTASFETDASVSRFLPAIDSVLQTLDRGGRT